MKDKLVFSILLCTTFVFLIASTVKADSNVTVNISTDGNVNFYSNLFSNGSASFVVNGTDVNGELNNLRENFAGYVSWNDMSYLFNEVAKYFYGGSDPHPIAVSIFNSLNSVFINRAEGDVINSKLDNLNMRVIILEKTLEKINSTVYCQAKLDVMKEYNLTWVKCGENSTYYYNVNPENWGGAVAVGIEAIEPEVRTANMTITSFLISELKAEENGDVKLTIKNMGNIAGSASITLELPDNWSTTPTEVNFKLNPTEEKTAEFTIFVPKFANQKETIKGIVSFVHLKEPKQLVEEKEVWIKTNVSGAEKTTFFDGLINFILFKPFMII